jgi:hypothetical protein
MRWDIINYLIDVNGYTDYLEVGVQDYYSCCDKIIAKNKTTVDPAPRNKCDYVMTSDSFFKHLDSETKYDIVFIDGLHHKEQVLRDIENSLKHLKEGGTIVVHDCLPTTEQMQMRNDTGGPWMGDVWKSIVQLKATREDLSIATVDHDCGCAIVKVGKQSPIFVDMLDFEWEGYCANRDVWLNIITYDNFIETYGKA